MAALMVVRVMALAMGVFVAMNHGLVAVLLAVVSMGLGAMSVFVLVLIFAVATHVFPLLYTKFLIHIVTRFWPRSN